MAGKGGQPNGREGAGAGTERRARRRGRLLWTALLLAGAVAAPVVANALVRRRARPLPPARWGRSHRYAWEEGAVSFQELGARPAPRGTDGAGPPLVLLHSLGPGHDGSEWLPAAERLSAAYRVYVPDLPGWGRSQKPPLPYTPSLYLHFLEDFLAEVVREPALLAAAGLSGAHAAQLAATHPALVRGLALVAPLGLDRAAEGRCDVPAALETLLSLPVAGTSLLHLATTREALARHLRRDVYAAPERVDAALVDHHWRASHLPGAHRALAAWASGHLDLDVADLLPRLQAPVWLGWGRASRRPPVEAADLWLHRLPAASLEVFSGSGALPHAEEPAAFAAALGRWIGALPG